MISGQEKIIVALTTLLQNSIASSFTGTTTLNSAIVTAIPSTVGLFVGVPVGGPGVPDNAAILSIDGATQVTLTEDAIADGTAVTLTTGFRNFADPLATRRQEFADQTAEQPALYVVAVGAEDTYHNTILTETVIHAEVRIFSRSGSDPDAIPGSTLNALVDAVRSVLFTIDDKAHHTLTLGGLVQWCRIEGTSRYIPGDTGPQAKAVIPIRILVP